MNRKVFAKILNQEIKGTLPFTGPGLWARMANKDLDHFWRIVWASMQKNDMEEQTKSVRYAYRKVIASTMRREGFKFYPILKNEDPHYELRSTCDYRFSLNIKNNVLKLEIQL